MQMPKSALRSWFTQAKQSQWKHIADVRRAFPHGDAVGEYTVFNVGGNKYRLITVVDYETGKVFIHDAMIHAQYDRWNGE